ncbi:MAG: hypothetical protein J6125_02215, partial [Clostridia bacterium]|nr:hypothetical protein [Clostridia bacterium]
VLLLSRRRPRLLAVWALSLGLLAAVTGELFFNFRAFRSAHLTPVDLTPYIAVGGIVRQEEDPEGGLSLTSTDNKRVICEFSGFSMPLSTLHVSIACVGEDGAEESVSMTVYANDAGHETMKSLGERTVCAGDLSSHLALNTAGETSRLQLAFSGSTTGYRVREVTANARRPFVFVWWRAAGVALLVFCLFLLRPGSPVWERRFDERTVTSRVAAAVVCAAVIGASLTLLFSNRYISQNVNTYHDQYQQLARQLKKGEVTYPAEPPAWLAELDNPYDTDARYAEARIHGGFYRWDSAYYNGKYYVYFGVVPAVVAYLPYHLLTGKDLPNGWAVTAFVLVFLLCLWDLLRRVFGRHFPDAPAVLFPLSYVLLVSGGGLVALLIYPGMYCVPISAGLAFSALGLDLWYAALERERLSAWRLCLGSLSMALVAGCRPQMVVLSFLALPLFWRAVFSERTLGFRSRGAVGRLLAFLLPYAVIAAALMYYNAIRFGSPFDFGANYNLTTNDMTVRGFRLDRTGLAIFQYLLQLPVFTSVYPFIRSTSLNTAYLGVTIWEATYGGLFAIAPFSLLSLGCFRLRRALAERRLFVPAVMLLGGGVLVAWVDAQMAGLLHRYFADFSSMILGAALLVAATVMARATEREKKVVRAFLIVGCLWSLWHTLTVALAGGYVAVPISWRTALMFWS